MLAEMGDCWLSDDGKTMFIEKPYIMGNQGAVTIAYNIYDSLGNPVNYFYSNADAVAATCPHNGRFNVYVVVTDTASHESITLMTGWFDVTGYEKMKVEDPEWKMSDDGLSCFIWKPAITGANGKVTIAYNIYDSDGNAINYFYSNEPVVAATCPANGTYNVFVVVTDAGGVSETVMTGWFIVEGYPKDMPQIYAGSEELELLEEDETEEGPCPIKPEQEVWTEEEAIPVMEYEAA